MGPGCPHCCLPYQWITHSSSR